MSGENIIVGPPDQSDVPRQSFGLIYYNTLQKRNPHQTILIDNEEITYEQLHHLAVKLALQLRNFNVKPGEVVTIISQNHWRFVVAVLAGFYIGATVNLLNPDYTAGELKHFFDICHPTVVFCTDKSLSSILTNKSAHKPSLIVNFQEQHAEGVVNLQSLDLEITQEDVDVFQPTSCDPEKQVAMILASSGTTGLPKAVMLTHANLRMIMSYTKDPNALDLKPGESTVAYLPFFHVFGGALILACVLHNVKAIIMDKFIPDKFLSTIQEHKITKLFAVPPILLFLVKSPVVNQYDISSIKDVLCGAAAISKDLEIMVENKLKIKSVRQVYGMTETAGAITITPKNVKKTGSVGKVINCVSVKVCDVDTGMPLGPNKLGELRVKGNGIMQGYCQNVKETESAFDETGFLKTGDLGYYDEEEFFYIVDRLKEIIKYKGFQVSPAELESLLIQHPTVKDAGVVGIPDERSGEVPLAFIVKQPNKEVTEDEIIRYIEENVSIQKRLYGGVKFVQEIPKNPTGKVLRRKLKEMI